MRQFLAIDLPDGVRRALATIRAERERSEPGWRWVDPDSLHLTIRFLGPVADERDRVARAGWREAAAGAPPAAFRLEGLGCFPPRGRPRVLWVGVRETGRPGALAALATAVERVATGAGFDPEPRPFRPHLTIARAARDGAPRGPADARWGPTGEVLASALVLFRSDLGPGGARYTALDRFPLGRERSDA